MPDRVRVRLSATLRPAEYESLTADVWYESDLIGKETPEKGFRRVEQKVGGELRKAIIRVFESAGYDAPFEEEQ